jgi:hypothetical protein
LDEGLHTLYSSTNIIRAIKSRKIRQVDMKYAPGKIRHVYTTLVEKLEGKGPLGRPTNKWGK